MKSIDIKEYGLKIGYNKVGITSVDSISKNVNEVLSRGEEYAFFQKMLTKPFQKNMPDAKSVIVLVLDYYQNEFPESLKSMIGKLYLNKCYEPPQGSLNQARIQLMIDYLTSKGFQVVTGGLNIPARWVAAQAGVTTYGKNTFAYADDIGSYIVIHTLLVDKELEYDQPTMESKCPPNCQICINACPTKALYEPYRLDPRRCIGFNNWITQDGRNHVTSFIPYELRESIGCKIHGCDICQDVCPRNQKKLKQPKPMDQFIAHIAPDITLSAILNMTDDFFTNRIQPIMYNYISEKRYFIRNAAIAMGNSKDEAFVKDLESALMSPDEMIRESVVWALGRIGGDYAKSVLEKGLVNESIEGVRQTILQALKP